MARPRAAATATRAGVAASRLRRASNKPKAPSFLSPVSSPPAARALSGRRSSSSSPSSSATPTAADLSFLSCPGSSANPKPVPRSSSSRRRAAAKVAARSPLASPRTNTASPLAAASPAPDPSPAYAAVFSVGDLRSIAASRMEVLKRRLDALHSRAHTDLDASLSRASKRFKSQNQAFQQLTDEVDKEYKKTSDSIKENTEMIKAKYKQIMAEAQSSTSRGTTSVSIPEMTKSVEKAIDGLRSRYNISMPV